MNPMSNTFPLVTKVFVKRAWPWAMLAVSLFVMIPLAARAVDWFVSISLLKGDGHPLIYQFYFWGGHCALIAQVCGLGWQGASRIILGLPLSSARLASGIMFSTVGAFVFLSLITNSLYRIIFDVNWPVWGPTLFMATLIMVAWCAFWDLQAFGFAKMLFWICFILAMFGWVSSRYYPNGFGGELVYWNDVTPTEFISLLIVFAGAWGWGIKSFSQIRCGAAVPSRQWSSVESWLNGLSYKKRTENRQISNSKIKSFARLHWDESGRQVVLLTASLGCLALVFNLAAFLQKGNYISRDLLLVDDPAVVTIGVFILSTFGIVAVLGASISLKDMKEMKGYLAVLPVSDQEFSVALIYNLFKSIGMAVLFILLLGFGGSYLYLLFSQGTEILRTGWEWLTNYETKQSFVLVPALFLLGYWAVVANVISQIWKGDPEQLLFKMPLCFGLMFLGMYSLGPNATLLQQSGLLIVSGLIWRGTVVAFMKAHRINLISDTTLMLAFLVCLILPLGFWFYWESDRILLRLFQSSLLVLAVTPFATIPLAVSFNRHR